MKASVYFLLFILMGCTHAMGSKEYLIWYESSKNPLKKTQSLGDIIYTCTYLVDNYFKARDFSAGSSPDPQLNDTSEYYRLNIKIANHEEPLTYQIKSPSESYERINYLVSGVNDDILLVADSDTLSCQMHHYERVYHVGNTISILFVFDKTHTQKEKSIVFYDKLFSKELVTFTFTPSEINSLPPLNP